MTHWLVSPPSLTAPWLPRLLTWILCFLVSQIIGTLVGTPTLSNALADLVSVVTVKSPHSADDLTGVLKASSLPLAVPLVTEGPLASASALL